MERIDNYIDKICTQIDGNQREIQDFREEMKYHLLESVKESILAGESVDQSVENAINRFGGENNFEKEISKEFMISKRIHQDSEKVNKSKKRIDVKMYFIGILFYIIALSIVARISDIPVQAFIAPESFFIVLISIVSVIVATKSFKDFINGLKLVLCKKHSVSLIDIYKSINTYELLIKASIGGGIMGFIIGIIGLLGKLRTINELGPCLAISLVSIIYGVLFAYFIFMPIKFRLENEKE